MLPRIYLTLCVIWTANSAIAEETQKRPIDRLIENENVWKLDQDRFEKKFSRTGFRWNSSARQTARFVGRGLTLWDNRVGETLVYFRDGKLSRITVSIFNRGDNKDIDDKGQFQALVGEWKNLVSIRTGVAAVDEGKSKTSAVNAAGYLYEDPVTTRRLEFSFKRAYKSRNIPFRAEFLKLQVAKTQDKNIFDTQQKQAQARRKTRALTRNKNGDVYMQSVPMVDQGSKGYCVVASAERVMRYYGLEVDQHEMAQIANSNASSGTNSSAMVASLKRLTGRLKLRVRTHSDMEWNDFKDMAKVYNRYAKRKDTLASGKSKKVDPERLLSFAYEKFDGPALRDAMMSKKSRFGRFRRDVRSHIDKGIPLLWSLYLGYFPEEGLPQPPNSGHMRLIIGYNDRTGEILYSDSWGAGHELKRMPEENAYTSTTGLFTIEPYQ